MEAELHTQNWGEISALNVENPGSISAEVIHLNAGDSCGSRSGRQSSAAQRQSGQQSSLTEDGVKSKVQGGQQLAAFARYLREIAVYSRLSPEDEVRLAFRVRQGDDDAREKMINANLRLVVKIARDYEGYGMPILDLISEGNIGLMKAVDHFDPTRGVKFSTYAAYWIKQAVKRCLSDQSRTVRIPIYMVEKMAKLRYAAAKLSESLDRKPTEAELAESLETTVDDIRAMQRAQRRSVSFNEPYEPDESETLQDRIADEGLLNPSDQFELQTSMTYLCNLLDRLKERDSTILRERFGLDGRDPKTLEEIGEQFGITRERIRQLQNMALVQLRELMEQQPPAPMPVCRN